MQLTWEKLIIYVQNIPRLHVRSKGVYIATQLNSTQLTQLNSVQPSQSSFCLWRHDLQTESTVIHAFELSSVEFRWVELSCVAINGP